MRGRGSCWAALVGALALVSGCGGDSVAGKTTTTTNGGGGVVARAPDGRPLAGALVLAARTWDSARGVWGAIDTLHCDAAGTVLLPTDRYAFLEIRDRSQQLGAWIKAVEVPEGSVRSLTVDTLRPLRGQWADRATTRAGRFYLDSSFHSADLGDLGTSFDFGRVPVGVYTLRLEGAGGDRRPMGTVLVEPSDLRYVGSGNVVLEGDTTGSPLRIEDFEADPPVPLLRGSVPQVAGWYVWSTLMSVSLPTSSSDSTMRLAIGPDSLRPSRAYHSRFLATSPDGRIGFGLTRLHLDVGGRGSFCFRYRSDTSVTVQFQRDSLAGGRPAAIGTLPSSPAWVDACLATSDLVPNGETPDSLKTWSAFGKAILTIEFHAPAGGTYLDLDDIRMR